VAIFAISAASLPRPAADHSCCVRAAAEFGST